MTLAISPLLSRSELLDASIILAKRHSFAILLATLPALVPAVLLDMGIHLLTGGSDIGLFAMPASLMLWGLAEGMAIAASWDLLHGEQPNATRAWRLVGRRPLAVALGYCFKWLMILLGLFLLIAPGFYLIGRWFAVPATTIVEHATLPEAFRRSRQLVRDDLTRVLWTLGLVETGSVLVAFVVPALLPGASLESPSLAQTASYWVLGVILLPLRAGLTAMLYLDIRMRREGYDLQQRLSGLDGAA